MRLTLHVRGRAVPGQTMGDGFTSPFSAGVDRAAWSGQRPAAYPVADIMCHTRDRDGTTSPRNPTKREPTKADLAGH